MKQPEISAKIALDNWRGQIKAADDLFNQLTDEDLQSEIAPGKNRGIYLLGHLTAVHDRMLPLLGFQEQKYPHLNAPFLTSPDKSVDGLPSATELRASWKDANETLTKYLDKLTADEWFQKHTSVTAEDFANEPHRNRLNVVASRTLHLSNHIGQLLLLKK